MPSITCPSCGEKGRVPAEFVGIRIKCKKCGNAFLVAPSSAKPGAGTPTEKAAAAEIASPVAAAPARPRYEGIEVEGLDESAWSTEDVARVEHDHESPARQEGAETAFVPHEAASEAGVKQYKVLSPRDKFFAGQFDLELLEKALNHYARQGWVVRGVTNPHVTIFGAEREQIVILMER